MTVIPRLSAPTIFPAKPHALGGDHVEYGEDLKIDDAIKEIAALLTAAYMRRARIRLVHTTPQALPSTEGLANTGETRPHELKLTGRRKESTYQ